MIATEFIKTQVFEVSCSHCHKVREVHVKEGLVGSKSFPYFIECVCGNMLRIELLKYLFRNREFMEDQLEYIIH